MQYFHGAVLMALILVSSFCAGMYNGKIASINQACVERPAMDYITASQVTLKK